MAAFYADENFRQRVVVALRLLGHDVLTCQEAGQAGQAIPDSEVLATALTMGRIVLTQNRTDFHRLHARGYPHVGIVTCTYDRDVEALARRIDQAVVDQEPLGRWLVRVIKPNPKALPRQET